MPERFRVRRVTPQLFSRSAIMRLTADWELSDLIGTEGALNYGAYASETTDLVLQSFAAAEDREAAAQRAREAEQREKARRDDPWN